MRFNALLTGIGTLLSLSLLISCTGNKQHSLRPEGKPTDGAIQLEQGDLKVVFTDNRAYGSSHLARFNGIAELTHEMQDSSVFVPQYAGFNLEHIFSGDSLVPLFEPREHPMELYKTKANQVKLHQKATPVSGVESLTTFTLVSPSYIDVEIKCQFHKPEFFNHGYAGLFWANYIDAPDDPKMYFFGKEGTETQSKWIGAWSKAHGSESTHISSTDDREWYFAPNFNATLANHFSKYRYVDPYFFGRFHNMVLAILFDPSQQIRFSQSPTGGSLHFTLKPDPGQITNPAWDFQWIIPAPKADKIYTLKTRMVYKPFKGAEDVADEYKSWVR